MCFQGRRFLKPHRTVIVCGLEKTEKRTPERVITYLTQDETRRLFGAVKDKRDRALFRLAYEHGLRASEVGLLQRNDVDFQQLRITITRLKGSLSSGKVCNDRHCTMSSCHHL